MAKKIYANRNNSDTSIYKQKLINFHSDNTTKRWSSKLSNEDALEIAKHLDSGIKAYILAEKYSVSDMSISRTR